ncbi:MAG: hypothetical protein DRH32_01685 [Deltaproteobacteria bacterium]|nr:MAG: hypothetical protein DRH32_01685 [Deltaproteobacteria bacterium]
MVVKRSVLFLAVAGFILLAARFATANCSVENSRWEKVVEKNGITVYERSITGRPIKVFKAESVFECAPMQVIALLMDRDAASRCFPHCRVFKLLEDLSPYDGLFYCIFDFPWPLKARDAVLRSRRTYDPVRGMFTIRYWADSSSDYRMPGRMMIRVASMEGEWTVTGIEDGRTRVTNRLYADPGGSLPYWVFNTFFRDAAYSAFVNMKKAVSDEKYRDALSDGKIIRRFDTVSGGVAGNHAF